MIRPARDSDQHELARMRALLWPDSSDEECVSGNLPSINLVDEDDEGRLIGFIEVGLRSHADGCDPARPVGFVEGWFVHERFRKLGVGRALMRAAEEWARAQGCREMASDTWIDHEDSQHAHEALGFEVVDRCVHYRKAL